MTVPGRSSFDARTVAPFVCLRGSLGGCAQFSGGQDAVVTNKSNSSAVNRATGLSRLDNITSREVAKLAGVSQATVSRVLTDYPGVRLATRQKVMRALVQTNYQPNAMARAMKTSSTGSIGVVVARLSNPLYPTLLQVIGGQLAAAGYRMIVWDSEYGGELPAYTAFRQGIVDGVILTTATAQTPFLRDLFDGLSPVVLINRTVEGLPCDQVASDNAGGGAQVAAYLLRSQRRHLALITGSLLPSTIREREQGYRQQLASERIALPAEYCQRAEAFSHASGRDAMRRLLNLATPPDAVFCANDVLALGAIDGARSRGVHVPDDLWVIGYDDIEMASWDAYDLTTVRQPLEEMVQLTIQMLISRITGAGQKHDVHQLPNQLIIRGSTAFFSADAAAPQQPAAATTEP
jgi:LacI family transcriptional regulator